MSANRHLDSAETIYRRNRKRRGRSKYLLSVEVKLSNRKGTKLVPAKLVFVRNRNKKKDYLVLISTDTSLSEEEIIRIYGKRWDIEVFFKVCKSYLHLIGECRSISYDAMTSYVAIVFARYMMLSTENRVQLDARTLGELFYEICDELPDITWIESFTILMEHLVETITERLSLKEEELKILLEEFMSVLPKALKLKAQMCA